MSDSDKSEGDVTERRNVEDLSTNEQVDEAVDDMLEIPEEERPDRDLSVPDDESDLQSGSDDTEMESDDESSEMRPEVQQHMEQAKEQQEEKGSTEVTVSSLDEPDDWEEFDFDGQEWTLDQSKEPEVREISGMKFLFKEPADDDEILNQLEKASEGGRWEQMYALVVMVVEKPEVTEERWEGMNFAARLSLGSAAADYLGLDEGFLDE